MKFGKANKVFIPSTSPDYFSGFPGYFMTNRESNPQLKENEEKLDVYGPSSIGNFLCETRLFMGPSSQLNVHIYGDKVQNERNYSFRKMPRGQRHYKYGNKMVDEDLKIDILQNFR